MMNIANSTIHKIEGKLISSYLKSGLSERLKKASKKKIKNLSPEEIRMLIGQKIGLPYLVPIALDFLEENPLCSGALYPGDLVSILLDIPKDFWRSNPDLNNRLVEIHDSLNEIHKTLETEILPKMKDLKYMKMEI